MRTAARRGRSSALTFFLVQGVVSGTSFLVWALASHVLPPAAQVPAATALSWGMVLYLPLTLGLPYLLPNLHRTETKEAVERREQVLRALSTVASLTAFAAVALAALGVLTRVATAPLALALALAGGVSLGITVQQLARIRRRLRVMVVATLANLLLPGGWLVGELITGNAAWSALLACALFLAYDLVARRHLAPRARRFDPVTLRRVLRRSIPLVPHLLAFGVLAQGVRFAAPLIGTPEAGLLQAHFVMTFLSMGMTGVAGLQSIVSVDVQLAAPDAVRRVFRRSLVALAAAGVAVAAVVVGIYASPLRMLFSGAAAPEPLLLAALALPLPLQSVYFALNNLYLREERTVELAMASGITAVSFLTAELALRPPTLTLSLLVYDAALAALPVLLAARLRWMRSRSRRTIPLREAAAA